MKSTVKALFIFICVAVLSIGLRLWNIDKPVADWHSFRQADTASVARNFTMTGIDLLHPTYHDLSNIQSGKDNPNGYRMVEFPLYQAIGSFFARLFPSISLEIWLRLLTICSSTLTGFLIGYIVWKKSTLQAGVISALVYAVLPYSIFYGRVILPEPFMVALAMLGIVFFGLWQGKKHVLFFILSIVFSALSLLVKPYALFLLIALASYLMKNKKIQWRTLVSLCVWGILTVIPLLLWRQWILQYPEGIPASDWLFNKGNIRFKGAWFYWLFAERISNLILGYWGVVLLCIGMMIAKTGNMFRLLLLGSVLFLIIIAGGNVQHDYYQILVLPVISIYVGMGLSFLLSSQEKGFGKISRYSVALVTFVFALMFSWYTIRTYYWINNPSIILAGKVADKILPKTAKVIAPYNGDTAFLYQTKRSGWPIGFDIDKKITMGATSYVTTSTGDPETVELSETYTVLEKTDAYVIIDLTTRK